MTFHANIFHYSSLSLSLSLQSLGLKDFYRINWWTVHVMHVNIMKIAMESFFVRPNTTLTHSISFGCSMQVQLSKFVCHLIDGHCTKATVVGIWKVFEWIFTRVDMIIMLEWKWFDRIETVNHLKICWAAPCIRPMFRLIFNAVSIKRCKLYDQLLH